MWCRRSGWDAKRLWRADADGWFAWVASFPRAGVERGADGRLASRLATRAIGGCLRGDVFLSFTDTSSVEVAANAALTRPCFRASQRSWGVLHEGRCSSSAF